MKFTTLKVTARPRVLAIILVLACGSLAAQSVPEQSSASLLANVIDRNGRPVRDLTKGNFQVKVNGHPATHVEASYSMAPRRIVVLLDMSGSMAGKFDQKKWQVATEAVEDVFAETPADASIAFVTFSDQVHDMFDFTQSRSSMVNWLQKGASQRGDSRVHGRTALFDALQTGTKLFAPPRPGDAMYLISDAGDNSSRVRSREIRELLLRSRIRLFVFLFADPIPFPDEDSATEAVKEISRATGGFVFGVPSYYSGVQGFESWETAFPRGEPTREKIKLYTQSLNMQVNGFYTLRFDSPVAPGKARKVSMEVVDATGKARKDIAFTYSTLLPHP